MLLDSSSKIPRTADIEGVELTEPLQKEFDEVLTPGALGFVRDLARHFEGRRQALLHRRTKIQQRINDGLMPDFHHETEHIRTSSWKITSVPENLRHRPVEITGPASDKKMVINAFNSGANVFMADFEDAQSPTWQNTIRGQINLRDSIRGTIHYEHPGGRIYGLNDNIATLMVRPRGWHLVEKHVLIEGKPISASLFDFGLFFFHNAEALIRQGRHPYFYLPKLENYLEARLWNDIFVYSENELDLDRGTIKATVLIETVLAAFEMDEILYELREHSAGLNCGRWDYIFSVIKTFQKHSRFVLPDRSAVTMDKGFLAAYAKLLIDTCHRRGAHALGGMAAQIPIKDDEVSNLRALEKVRADKVREVDIGHDGTWVAHPGLVWIAKEVFTDGMPGLSQLNITHPEARGRPLDLLAPPSGKITELGLRTNIRVGIQYLEAWLGGIGAVAIDNLMEDAATCEICRAQVWQWMRHHATLSDGQQVDADLVDRLIDDQLGRLRSALGESRFTGGRFQLAARLFRDCVMSENFVEFMTIPAYEYID